MTLEQAKLLRSQKLHLIGTKDSQGFTISDILIIPSSSQMQEKFLQYFLISNNAEEAISSFHDEDMHVWAIDDTHLQDANILFYDDISNE